MGSDPWTPSKALPWGPYSTPRLQLARAMTFACQHDIIINPTNFWWWWFEEGGSHEIFTNREGGSTIFLLFPGGIKNFTESFIPFLPHPPPPPRELENDNSIIVREAQKLLPIYTVHVCQCSSRVHEFPSLQINS